MLLQCVLAQVRHFPGGFATLSCKRHHLSPRALSVEASVMGVAATDVHALRALKRMIDVICIMAILDDRSLILIVRIVK